MKRADIELIFRRHGPSVYRRALRILGNPSDAAEAVNEVFIRALKSSETFQQKCEVAFWLNRITTNYCLNQIRDTTRRNELFQEKVPPKRTLEIADRDVEKAVLIRRLLAAADQTQATAACYVYVDGMSHAEAASIMGVSRRTVGNLIDRFLRWSREYLASDGEKE